MKPNLPASSSSSLSALSRTLCACTRCPRLVRWRAQAAREKPPRFADWAYWAKPVPGFGDPKAKLVIFGLAPGAHGSNRTGRPFTGDASGDFLYPALFRAGMASQALATGRDDGMKLQGVYITAAVRCAPPGNKPTPKELANCADWTIRELALLPAAKAFLALGKIGHDALLKQFGLPPGRHPFGHGAQYPLPDGKFLLDSYHVSRQNTNTGVLTVKMFDDVLMKAKKLSGM